MNTTSGSGLLSFDTHWEFKFPYFVCVATSNKQENIWLLLGVTNEVIFRSSDLQQQYIWKYNPFHFSSMYRNKVLWLMAWRNEDWRREQMDVWLPASSASVCAHLTRDFLLLYHLNPIILWAFPVKNDGTCLYCLYCIFLPNRKTEGERKGKIWQMNMKRGRYACGRGKVAFVLRVRESRRELYPD